MKNKRKNETDEVEWTKESTWQGRMEVVYADSCWLKSYCLGLCAMWVYGRLPEEYGSVWVSKGQDWENVCMCMWWTKGEFLRACESWSAYITPHAFLLPFIQPTHSLHSHRQSTQSINLCKSKQSTHSSKVLKYTNLAQMKSRLWLLVVKLNSRICANITSLLEPYSFLTTFIDNNCFIESTIHSNTNFLVAK